MKMYEAKRLHPVAAVLLALRTVKDFLLPILIIFVTQIFRGQGTSGEYYYRILFGAVFLVLAVVSGVWSWAVFRYGTEDGKLFVYQGVFFKKRQYIPFERIQSIDLTEGVLHRLFGLVRVQVQTAGGSKPEAVLAAVTKEAAARLQEELRGAPTAKAQAVPEDGKVDSLNFRRTDEPGVGHPEAMEGQKPAYPDNIAASRSGQPSSILSADHPLKPESMPKPYPTRKLPFGQLFIAGLTSGSLGVAFSLIFAGATQITEFFPNWIPTNNIVQLGWKLIVVLLLGIILAAALVAILSAMLRFANFTITRKGEELLIERGLLEIKRVTLPLRRIQAILIVEEPIWQPFGLAAVHVESVGYGNEKGESTLLFPLLRRSEIQPFLEQFTPAFVRDETRSYTPVPVKAMPGYLLPAPVFLAIVTLLVSYFTPWGAVGWLLVAVFLLLGWWKHRSAGWLVERDQLIFRFRRISRVTAIIPRRRIQSYSISRHPLQLRKGLCTAKATVASGGGGSELAIKGMPAEDGLSILAWYRRWNDGPGHPPLEKEEEQ
ncbi:PH domain-containing protein [Paenibacillus sp. J2TS4]|uniref:PH domain-containing protein n=1 Tax=Paenibacillus sp. J2TS4 TaxID=2807194 RepID=UPI001B1110BE|nr:PH domain-containing protein [Paenibacillus sp. J2TS4]GIP34835.1 UPF0699 transmembrane protein YdbT [Paenibacillus sp. J2TS4]